MNPDYSDILGGQTIPIIRATQSGRWSNLSLTIKSAFILSVLLVGYVVGIRAWEHILKWRERSYRLSMRRRHGIPDNDYRPFNVAYAAVVRARRDNEAAKRSRSEQPVPSSDRWQAPPDQNVRQRPGAQRNVDSTRTSGSVSGIPGRFNASSLDVLATSTSTNDLHRRSPAYPLNFAERYNPSSSSVPLEPEYNASPPRAGPSRRSGRKVLNIVDAYDDKKRGFDQDALHEPDISEKTRVEGDDLIDGDEEAEWDDQAPRRGSKRVLGDEEEKRTRDKRPRKVSLEKKPYLLPDEDMEVDDNEEEDEVTDLRPGVRGKKRDRAEAGSTFGGDDEDSAPEAEVEDDAKARRRRRKRRTVAKRKFDGGAALRGQKRDRDVEEGESGIESDNEVTKRVSRKKRGKKTSLTRDDEERRGGSDISMDDSQTSARSKPRRIGDEWENNGVKYKIGPNGQRLRQALVKKARQKFPMPKDSQHPDRDANLEICVEAWLTEEEYRDAKSRHTLAWQDSPKASVEPETPVAEVQEPPSPQVSVGKNLLWGSTTTTPAASPVSESPATPLPKQKATTRDPYRQSIATNMGLRLNPFQQPQVPAGRRIASGARVASAYNGSNSVPISPGLSDSTNGSPRGYRQFSKWEKQDLEAKAMMKIREANRKKQEEKEKEEQGKNAAMLPAIAAPSLSFAKPASSATPASAEVKAETKAPILSFGIPTTAAKAGPADPSKPLPSPFGTVPSITVTPPSTLPTAAKTSPNPPPANPFPQVTTQPPSTSSPFSFGTPSAGASPAKPKDVFGATRAVVDSGNNNNDKAEPPAKPPTAFGFPPASGGGPSTSTAPSSSSLSSAFSLKPAAQTTAMEDKKDAAPSLFSRLGGFSGGSTQASGSSLGSGSGPGAAQQTQAPAQPSTTVPMFSFSKPGAAGGSALGSPSVFGNTAASATQPASVTAVSANSAPSSGGLKFNFGVGGKPPGPAPAATTSSAFSTRPGAGAGTGDAPKLASNTSPFGGFSAAKAPETSASGSAMNVNGTTSAPTPPKFSFGIPSAFGPTKAAPTTAPQPATASGSAAPATSDAAPKSAFSGFGGAPSSSSTSTAAASPFGTSGAFGGGSSAFGGGSGTEAPKPSPFGTPSAFGSGSGAFGAASKSAEAPKPSPFGTSGLFGGGSGAFGGPGPGTAAPAEAPKTNSLSGAFGAGPSVFGSLNSTKAPEAPKSNTSGFGSSNSFGGSSFGTSKPAETPSTFGFGTNSTAATGEAPKTSFSFAKTTPAASPMAPNFSFKFGDSAASGSTSSTTPLGSPFGSQPGNVFGAQPSANGGSAFGAQPASTGSAFGAQPTTTGSAFGAKPSAGPSAFGFGAPASSSPSTGSFSFGASAATQEK